MSTTGQGPLEIVRSMYSAFEAKDEARLRDLIDVDVTWNQCQGFPGGARRQGLEALMSAVFAGDRATWTGFAAPVEELIESGDRVVALGHDSGTHAVTGKPMRAAFAHVYRVRATVGSSEMTRWRTPGRWWRRRIQKLEGPGSAVGPFPAPAAWSPFPISPPRARGARAGLRCGGAEASSIMATP